MPLHRWGIARDRLRINLRAINQQEDRYKPTAEAIRCAEIEGRREAQLIQEAEGEARRRRIERCEYELARLAELPQDIQDKAYLVAMGVRDWQAERDLLEKEKSDAARA